MESEQELQEILWISTGPEQTEALGEALGRTLPAGAVLALDGDLGAGKTTLTRGLGRGLGGYEVSSPTFTLHDLHEGGRLALSHFDAWMEGREKALLEDGGDEWLGGDGIAVIEWAPRVARWLPSPRVEVRLAHRGEEERQLVFQVVGSAADPLARALQAALQEAVGAAAAAPGGPGDAPAAPAPPGSGQP